MRPYGIRLQLAAMLGILFSSGCGEPETQFPKCYPVSGSVRINGEAAVRALVSFHPLTPQEGGEKHVGQTTTDDNGDFQMTTFSAGDGVPPGEYVVTIVANWISRDDQDVGVDDLLGGKYSTPEKSTLKVTVEDEPLELDPFDLQKSSN